MSEFSSSKTKGISFEKWFKTALIPISLAICFYLSVFQWTPSLSMEGQRSILLMVTAIVWWGFELIPIGVSTLLFTMYLSISGIVSKQEAFQHFFNPTLVFIISAMIIGKVFIDTGLGKTISRRVVHLFGTDSKMVLLSFMVSTSLISTILVDIPTAIIFASIGYEILKFNDCKPGYSNFGKSMMMGIPIASALGGFGTPAGSGINILAINLMKEVAGIELSFLTWTLIGLPSAIILTFIAWFILLKLYPAEIKEVKVPSGTLKESKTFDKRQTQFICIFALTVIGWFSGVLPIPMISIMAVSVLFLPGIDLITWENAKDAIPVHVLLLIGASQSLGYAIYTTGAAEWIAGNVLSDLHSSGLLVILLLVSSFGIFSHLILPVASAVLSVCIPVLSIIASQHGLNPAMLILPIAFTASCVFLIPLDPIPLTTIKYGYWKIYEMPLPGLLISIFWIGINVTAMLIASTIGLI